MKKANFYKLSFTGITLIIFCAPVITGQVDSLSSQQTLTSISDTASTIDTLLTKKSSKPFLTYFKRAEIISNNHNLGTRKRDIDFSDYRNSAEILSYIPAVSLNSFGNIGAPNSINIFGIENITFVKNEINLNKSWNNFFDLNLIQIEDVNKIEIAPVHRGYLYGFNNNPAGILITSHDTLKSKPISRIRYYQAPHNEGFVDAFFSARVLNRMSIVLRLSNSSIDNYYLNQEFGSWKFKIRINYKLFDSVYTALDYYHKKLNTPLNGGVNIANLLTNSTSNSIDIYSNANPVYFDDINTIRKNTSTINDIYYTIFGNIIPYGYTSLTFNYFIDQDRFQQKLVPDTLDYKNKSEGWSTLLKYNIQEGNTSVSVVGGYNKVKYDINTISKKINTSDYYASGYIKQNLFDGLLTPAIFGKYSNYLSQKSFGFGGEILFTPLPGFNLLTGFSSYERPFSLLEKNYISSELEEKHKSYFASIEFAHKNFNAAISYSHISKQNPLLPIFNTFELSNGSNNISFTQIDNSKIDGINFNSSYEQFNILISTNINYYSEIKNFESDRIDNYNFQAGIYYVDTLFNSNLNLKTGFNFYLFDTPEATYYDFQRMKSSQYLLDNGTISKLPLINVINDKYRLDFVLMGRIQNAATFYFTFENIFGSKYFIIPYYPMPESGMRIGISWDFLD